jgi:hypothetical protein
MTFNDLSGPQMTFLTKLNGILIGQELSKNIKYVEGQKN